MITRKQILSNNEIAKDVLKNPQDYYFDFAERFLAKILETGENRGSSPQVACEMLRQFGVPPESVYPFDEAVRTTDVYFKELYPELYEIAKEFNEEWDFKHDFVPTNSQDITQALKTSPLMISVYAWTQNEKGLYYRPTGVNDTHATTLFYERQDDFRRVFDSYADISDSVIKDYDWNSMPIIVKRFWIEKKVIEEYSSIGSVLIAWIKKIIKWLTQ